MPPANSPEAPDTANVAVDQSKPVSAFTTLKILIGFARPYKMAVVAAMAALIFTASVTLVIGQGVRMLIDQGFVANSMSHLNSAIGFLAILVLLMAVGTFVRFYLVSWLGERVTADIRKSVFNRIIGLHPAYFESNRSGEIMSRLTTDTTLLQNIIGSSFSMAARNTLTLIGGIVMLLLTNFKLTLIVLGSVPLILLPIFFYGNRVRKLSRASQDSVADVGTYAGEIIQHIKTVQSYTREEAEKTAFGREVENAFAVGRKRVQQRAALIAAVILLVFGAIAGMLWVGGGDVLRGEISAGQLGAFVFYSIMVASSVATVSEVLGELQRAAGATERIVELISQTSALAESESPNTVQGLSPQLSLRNISFAYPSRPKEPALRQLSLEVEAGKCLALVGPSGAGKSTVFELLQRFYDPQEGEILLGGTDIRSLSLQDLRASMAVVPQQPALFTADVSYNIRYGRPEASDEEVIAAAKAAHAHDFICALPDGYQSDLGEQGVRLSGGQRQRIAIARAILKDPSILLLDEATSALDAESEHLVQAALTNLMRGRTTIIIAHRLSTILHADSIAVLQDGQLIAQGDHNALMESCELYKKLARLQFRANEVDDAVTHGGEAG